MFSWSAANAPCLLLVAMALALFGCSDPAAPVDPVREIVTITDQEHHLGDNPGAEGLAYDATFELAGQVDSAFVSVTFLYPNSFGQSGPEIESPPVLTLNGSLIGIASSDFPADPSCVSGTGASAEYECDVTIELAASAAVTTGSNSIRIASEAASGGDDDFVFTDLVVTVWR